MRRVAAGWALLTLAWVFGNAPFASPDEVDHYARAAGVWNGSFVAQPARNPPLADVIPTQRASYLFTAGSVRVPAGLAPPETRCFVGFATSSAACLTTQRLPHGPTTRVSSVATYPPLPYLVEGVPLRLAAGPMAAVRLGRFAGAVLALALLAAALIVLAGGDVPPLASLGPAAAVTPMVLFCAASLGGSGLEICAAIALYAAILRGTREQRPPTYVWGLLGAAGLILALSRSSGLLWIVLAVPLALGLGGLRGTLGRMREGGLAAGAALAAVACGVVGNRVWEAVQDAGSGVSPGSGLRGARGALGPGVDQWWDALHGAVGRFGHLEVTIPWPATWAWLLCCIVLAGSAAAVAARRERYVLAATVVVAGGLPFALWLLVVRWTGYGLQARYLLPAFVAVPLVAGELLARRADRLSPRIQGALLTGVPVVLGAAQAVAWWWNARRGALGIDGSLLFAPDAHWSPPLGWWPWITLALLGSLALAGSGLARLRRPVRVAHPAQQRA